MSFVDWRFLVFLPTVFVLNYLFPLRYRWALLLAASYFFYMSWKPEYGALLLLITTIDYLSGLMLGRVTDPRKRKAWLLFSLCSNLGILFVFKYFDFVFGSLQTVVHALGSGAQFPVLSLLLPIGISFHTFQSISYTIDVYMDRVKPVKHFGRFALYVSFFPQLVAGPIERPTGLLQQLLVDRPFDADLARQGMKLMAWGFFKKMVIADRLGPIVNAVYASPQSYSGPSLILTTVLFAYQIYCDFSGYTDIARGAANLFGYRLTLNFDDPYIAKSIGEFWRRWHISLSSWFRDYVYIPLGGNRVSKPRKAFNIMVTFLLSGLWHGANWTFVFWGGLNGFYLIVSDMTKDIRERISSVVFRGALTRFRGAWQILATFSLVCIAWIFFRATSLSEAWYILSHMGQGLSTFVQTLRSNGGAETALAANMGLDSLVIGLGGALLLEAVQWAKRHAKVWDTLCSLPQGLRFSGYYVLILCILLFGRFVDNQQFIYFRF